MYQMFRNQFLSFSMYQSECPCVGGEQAWVLGFGKQGCLEPPSGSPQSSGLAAASLSCWPVSAVPSGSTALTGGFFGGPAGAMRRFLLPGALQAQEAVTEHWPGLRRALPGAGRACCRPVDCTLAVGQESPLPEALLSRRLRAVPAVLLPERVPVPAEGAGGEAQHGSHRG